MKYVYCHHPSKLATIMVGFGAGSRVEHQSKYPKGIAHVMEHSRFLGTEAYTAKDLSRKLALQGGGWNAFTSQDMVCYHITLPEENLEEGLKVLSEVVMRPAYPQDKLDKELEVICQEARMYDDDIGSLVSKRLYERVFTNPLHTPIIGFEDSIRQITRQHLLDFNNEFYGPEKMSVVLAAPNNAQALVRRYLVPDTSLIDLNPRTEAEYAPGFEDVVVKDGQIQNTLVLAFGSRELGKLYESEAKTELFNRVFGCGDVSRLFLKVREDLGLVYSIHSGFSEHLDGSLYTISTLTEPGNQQQVIDAIEGEIQRMLKEPPTPEELQMAKNKFKSRVYGQFDSSMGAASDAMGELLCGSKSVKELVAEVNSITADDLMDIARIVFSNNRYFIIGKGQN